LIRAEIQESAALLNDLDLRAKGKQFLQIFHLGRFASIMIDINMLTAYKAWANDITFSAVASLPSGEATKQRQTRFGNMVHTLNHVYVIDDVFRSHLLGTSHGYTARNTQAEPTLADLWKAQVEMDGWYIEYAAKTSNEVLAENVDFQFVDGGRGIMSRTQIILHVVNHGTYHRGFVGDLMYQVPATSPANDLTVFLRDNNIQ
jgi:uncharacterized damage-inducible protein DinB